MKEHKFYNTTRIVLTLITGLLCLTIGLSLVNMRVSNIKAGIVTKATVIRVITNSDHEDVSYKPILRFINNQNTPMIFKPYACGVTTGITQKTAMIRFQCSLSGKHLAFPYISFVWH